MSFAMFVSWVLIGVLAGVLAGFVMKRGGHGLKWDVILALVGSIGASWIFRSLGLFPEAGIVTMAVVAREQTDQVRPPGQLGQRLRSSTGCVERC